MIRISRACLELVVLTGLRVLQGPRETVSAQRSVTCQLLLLGATVVEGHYITTATFPSLAILCPFSTATFQPCYTDMVTSGAPPRTRVTFLADVMRLARALC